MVMGVLIRNFATSKATSLLSKRFWFVAKKVIILAKCVILFLSFILFQFIFNGKAISRGICRGQMRLRNFS